MLVVWQYMVVDYIRGKLKMNKIIVLMLILVSIVYAQEAIPTGENVVTQTVFTIPLCYDNALILVKTEKQVVDGDYIIEGCTRYEGTKWTCPCIGNNLTVNIISNKTNTYDLRLQYYVQPFLTGEDNNSVIENDINKRIENINNVVIKLPSKPFNISEYKIPILIAVGVLLFIIVDIIVIFRWLFREEREEKNTPLPPIEDEKSDEEVLNYIKNL